MPEPWSRSPRATAKSRSTSTPESAAVGSSMIRILAFRLMALAISMICWSAIDRPSAIRSGSIGTPKVVNRARACSRMAGRSIRPSRPFGCRPMKMFSATVRSGNRVGSW